jgi:hypothetical protein
MYLFAANESLAQSERPRRIEAGIFAGPAMDWAVSSTQGYKTTGVKGGGVYGVNIDINLHLTSSNYYFSTGINARHIRYGLKYTDDYSYYDDKTHQQETVKSAQINSTFNTIYLTIPTAIKFKTGTFFDRLVFFGLAGVEHGIAVSSKSNDEITRENDTQNKYEKIDHYKNTAVLKESLYIVLGAEFVIKDYTKATFGIGYNHGFNNMFRKKYKNTISDQVVKIHTHCIEFQFGIIF